MAEFDSEVLIIGGGISGLATAATLARNGVTVELWEKDQRLGGKIQTDHSEEGYTTEQAASLIMNFRPDVTRFIDEHGLNAIKVSRSASSEANRYLLRNGKLMPVPMKMHQLFTSPFWSLPGKLRLLAEPFIPKGDSDNETVSQFVRRRLGNEALERAMEPFVGGTLAGDPDQANASATLPRLTTLEKRYGSFTAGMMINKILRKRTAMVSESFSFEGGMHGLIKQLAKTPGLIIRSHLSAEAVNPIDNGWRVESNNGISLQVERLILATPADITAQLLTPHNSELADSLATIPYAPLAVVHTGFSEQQLQHPLDGTGFLVPRQEKLVINGNLWMSRLFPDRAAPGKVLLSSYCGGARRPEMLDKSDQQLLNASCDAMHKTGVSQGEAEWSRIDRHQRALPLYHGNYPQRIGFINQQLETMAGLELCGNYMGGVSIRDRIASAQQLAEKVIQQRQRVSTTHKVIPSNHLSSES